MTFDISKCQKDENGHLIARTKAGSEVLLFCTNAPGAYPLVGQIAKDAHMAARWTADGYYSVHAASPEDLINEPATHTVTVEVYRDAAGERRVRAWFAGAAPPVSWAETAGRKVITITDGEGLWPKRKNHRCDIASTAAQS